ncbi:MAG: PE-PPE domain-containing protein [Mycobacterium sp.]|nr:PE-PPE domain-containing protein [Mycobacterium sp.]
MATGLVALGATFSVALPSPVSPAVSLAATALYMGGTDHPLSIPEDTTAYITTYIQWAYNDFVGPSGLCTGGNPGCAQTAVYTPEQFWPTTGLKDLTYDQSIAQGLPLLDNCLRGLACTVTDPPYTTTGSQILTDTSYTVFSYSQSGAIASLEKSDLIAHPPSGTVNFVFESNPNRPNGGILERFVGVHIPILDVTFNGATVTNSPQPTPLITVDIVHQYDPVGDFPLNPLNAAALANSLMGFLYEHPEEGVGIPELQGQYQDSTYYLVPTFTLPLLQPLLKLPFLGPLIATTMDPPLRVLVESGYDRTINPGMPRTANYFYVPNLFTLTRNFLKAIPNGWDNGIAYLTGDPTNRPFHTTPQGPYGVGGPPVNAGAIDPYGPPTPSLSGGSAVAASPPQALAVTRSATTDTTRRTRPQRASAHAAATRVNHKPRAATRTSTDRHVRSRSGSGSAE